MDYQKYYAGKCFDAYEYLGTHACGRGHVFRVYAPAAFKVSLIGDFSGWSELPMNRILKSIFKTYDVLDENCKSELDLKPYQGAAYYIL